jgi:hypothetical protein
MIALVNQSLLDIAVQESGSVLAAFDWAIANGISITDDLVPGQKLVYGVSVFENDDILNYFKNRNQLVATAISLDQNNQTPILGIGTMTIESTFIIA